MDAKAIEQKCLDRLRELYPEPWFVWWGIAAGEHCGTAQAHVMPHGERVISVPVSDDMPITELLEFLEKAPVVDSEASLAQSGNYVADESVRPRVIWFNNGRVVRLVNPDGQEPYLSVGTDFHTKDKIFF